MNTAQLARSILLVSFTLSSVAVAQPPIGGTFIAPLSGEQEVPSVQTNARGQAIVQVNADESALDFRLIVSELIGVTQAHIHCGPAGANGPVTLFLFGLVPGGVDVSGILAVAGVTDADIIARPSSAECPGGVDDLADLVEQMRSGNAYVNVHTLANPGGEVRGQLALAGRRNMDRRR